VTADNRAEDATSSVFPSIPSLTSHQATLSKLQKFELHKSNFKYEIELNLTSLTSTKPSTDMGYSAKLVYMPVVKRWSF